MTQFLIYAGAFILVLFCVVLVHEAGHFVVGKLSGIKVEEFAVGFGPRILSRRRGETLYSLRAIPAGGFVRMAGMLGLAGETDAGERNFYRASIPRRLATIAAGIVFNFAFAIVCLTAVNAAPTPWTIQPGSPAAQAGLRSGDIITAVDGRPIRDDTPADVSGDLRAATVAAGGNPVVVTYVANNRVATTAVHPWLVILNPGVDGLSEGTYVIRTVNGAPVGTGDPATLLGSGSKVLVSGVGELSDGSPGTGFTAMLSGVKTLAATVTAGTVYATWRLGVAPGIAGEPLPAAVLNGAEAIPSFIASTSSGIYQLVTGAIPGGVTGPNGFSGPVGIAQETARATDQGLLGQSGLVWWIGIISMNLGFVNLLPIPFLDGGKLLFIIIEAVRRKRMQPRNEALITAIGLVVIVLFAIYVTIGDVSRL